MKPKIEIGKFARRKTDGKIVEKVISKDGWVSYLEDRKITGSHPAEEVEDVDVKTAFLTRLQELLATFDAKIHAWGDETYSTINIKIGDEKEWYYSHDIDTHEDNLPITAENVFDYDKD